MIKNINVRFFTYCNNEENDADICEITENQFLKLNKGLEITNPIYYERYTVFENGCNQICLTIEPTDWPSIDELERV